MSERVTIKVENHIADVRFNRPEKMNALDGEQVDAIVEAGEKLAVMEGVHFFRAVKPDIGNMVFNLDRDAFRHSASPLSSSWREVLCVHKDDG